MVGVAFPKKNLGITNIAITNIYSNWVVILIIIIIIIIGNSDQW